MYRQMPQVDTCSPLFHVEQSDSLTLRPVSCTIWSVKILSLSMLAAALCLSSCAYLQTHKNVKEAFHKCEGYRLVEPLQLYSAGGSWYLAVQPETMRLHYPTLHDSIFLENNTEPSYSTISADRPLQYRRISGSTAKVLLRSDGYYTISSLMEEIHALDGEPQKSLPAGATRHQIHALVEAHPRDNTATLVSRKPESTPVVGQVLSAVDFVCIDLPGSVAYNVAIPVMAPFVFFYNFIHED